jgi:transposase-like protein
MAGAKSKNNLGLMMNFEKMRTRRKFSADDRLSIIREAEREGRLETIRKYNLAPSLFDRWRNKYLNGGVDGLKNAHKRIDPHLRALEEENERLKRIIAKQSLEIEVKDELLKKSPIHPKTRR